VGIDLKKYVSHQTIGNAFWGALWFSERVGAQRVEAKFRNEAETQISHFQAHTN